MAFFYEGYAGLAFPGGSLEEIELKAAVGVKARVWILTSTALKISWPTSEDSVCRF